MKEVFEKEYKSMSYNLQIIFSVGLGGALGSILRFYAVDYIHKLGTNSFPFGILFVNMLILFYYWYAICLFFYT